MITENEFDFFLKYGYIEGLAPQVGLDAVIEKYGDEHWTVKEVESNGLIYGIIMVGMVEFHIYNEKLSGISMKPYAFDVKDYRKDEAPWIGKKRKLEEIIEELRTRNIPFEKYSVIGPKKKFKTAGVRAMELEDGQYVFLDTKGGVTFLFNAVMELSEIETYQICRYFEL